MAVKKTDESSAKKKPVSRKRKQKNTFYLVVKTFFVALGTAVWWLLKGLWIAISSIGKGIYWLSDKIVSFAIRDKQEAAGKGKLKSTSQAIPPAKITVIETNKGNYRAFFNKLQGSDSMIGIIVGARGSGKTAIALSLLENLKGGSKKFFAMGFQSKDLPDWIEVIEKTEDIQNDSFVVIDEGGILFSSRDSMSGPNKLLSELLFIARHKNLTIFFISQNSSNIEINTIRQSDFIILKKSSLLQKDFERKKIAEIYTQYAEGFEKHKANKGLTLIYSDQFIGFVNNDLPSFWSSKVSKGFRDSKK